MVLVFRRRSSLLSSTQLRIWCLAATNNAREAIYCYGWWMVQTDIHTCVTKPSRLKWISYNIRCHLHLQFSVFSLLRWMRFTIHKYEDMKFKFHLRWIISRYNPQMLVTFSILLWYSISNSLKIRLNRRTIRKTASPTAQYIRTFALVLFRQYCLARKYI